MFQCFWALGACFEVLLALMVMPTLGWQWLLALSTIPLLAFALITPVSAVLLHDEFIDLKLTEKCAGIWRKTAKGNCQNEPISKGNLMGRQAPYAWS
jgi:hypothetical protein